jgi:hypothetical protein
MSLLSAGILMVAELLVLSWLAFHFISGIVSVLHGAPYVPIEKYRIEKLLAFGGVNAQDILYDFGSGDGRVLVSAVRNFHVARAVGYEIAPWPYWKSRWILRRSGITNINVRNQSFFDADLGEATCVYAYLFPKLVDRLAKKFAKELKSGTRIICPSFSIDVTKHPEFRLKKEEKIGNITAYLYEKI